MEEDVKNEETQEETSESTEETSPEEITEEKTVPYHRFKEVNSKMRDLEQQIESLKADKKEGSFTPEQERELQAKQYLKNLLKETLTEEKKQQEEISKREEMEFNEAVNDALLTNSDVKRNDFLKFIETKSDKYGITSVGGAMTLYREINNLSKEAAEKAKSNLQRKPGIPKSEGEFGRADSYKEDKTKSFAQIADEAKKGLSK